MPSKCCNFKLFIKEIGRKRCIIYITNSNYFIFSIYNNTNLIKIYFNYVIKDSSIIIFNTSLIGASFKLFAIVTIPVILGIIFNTIFYNLSKKIDPIFDKLSLLIFLIIVGIAIYQDLYLIPEYIRYAGIKTVLIFVLAFIMCLFTSLNYLK